MYLMEHIIIIGNGISGITAARHIRKMSNKKITIISSETAHFYSRTALMYIYMGHMKFEHTKPYEDSFWEKNNLNLMFNYVKQVDGKKKELHLDDGQLLHYDKLILAVGSKPNKFGWKGQTLKGVTGLYSKQDLDNLEAYSKNAKRAVIVGAGLIGIELTEMLLSRGLKVTYLIRENGFWGNVLPKEESQMILNHMQDHHIDIRLNTNLTEIVDDKNGWAKSIITDSQEEIPCQIVGLTPGVSPNIDFLKNSELELNRGVLINPYLETNIQDIYAIGDCAEQRTSLESRRPIEAVWYTGRMMGETIAQTICNTKTKYKPGNWFNSAKFLDIEYQTYGWVWATPKENEKELFWKDSKEYKTIRIVYDGSSKLFLGTNVFGMRMRHSYFDTALTEKKLVIDVVDHLQDALFDPEFYTSHIHEIKTIFKNQL